MHTKLWFINLKEGGDFEDKGVGGKIILKCILNKVGGCGLDTSDSEL
jgi:hypothetical protein